MNNVLYKIINIQNQKFYVGSTTRFKEYGSIMEFVRQTRVPRSAAFKMLAGQARDGLTLERV